jgi:hypothetical protein
VRRGAAQGQLWSACCASRLLRHQPGRWAASARAEAAADRFSSSYLIAVAARDPRPGGDGPRRAASNAWPRSPWRPRSVRHRRGPRPVRRGAGGGSAALAARYDDAPPGARVPIWQPPPPPGHRREGKYEQRRRLRHGAGIGLARDGMALTGARELVRWFPLSATVTPGEGGSCAGPGTSLAVDVPHRRLGARSACAWCTRATAATPRASRWRTPAASTRWPSVHARRRRGPPRLRLVHPARTRQEWDDEFRASATAGRRAAQPAPCLSPRPRPPLRGPGDDAAATGGRVGAPHQRRRLAYASQPGRTPTKYGRGGERFAASASCSRRRSRWRARCPRSATASSTTPPRGRQDRHHGVGRDLGRREPAAGGLRRQRAAGAGPPLRLTARFASGVWAKRAHGAKFR